MVVFRNTFDSYHAVGQMSGHSQDRDFLYGGVTQLGGINPNMQHARDDMPTEFGSVSYTHLTLPTNREV